MAIIQATLALRSSCTGSFNLGQEGWNEFIDRGCFAGDGNGLAIMPAIKVVVPIEQADTRDISLRCAGGG
jgi:hypothetical protein